MSRIAQNHDAFNHIRSALSSHDQRVGGILNKFSEEVAATEKKYAPYRDSEKLVRDTVRELIPKYRVAILKEGIHTSEQLNASITILEDYLFRTCCRPVSQAFLRQLQAYIDNGMKPTRTEVESLIYMTEGSPVGLKLLHNALKQMDCDFTFDYRGVESYERDLDRLKEFSGFVRFNPSFGTDNAGIGAQLFGRYGRRVQFSETEHGDDMKVDYISVALPIRDEAGNDTASSWDTDSISAMAGRHDMTQRFVADACQAWEEPDLYPDVKQDPEALVRRQVTEATTGTAKAMEIVSQYVE